jgi:hypothetical protein
MEQGLADTSKYKISLISIDTRFATQKNAVNSTFRINAPFTMRNVMRVRMASLELPLVEYVFSDFKGNVMLDVQVGDNNFYNVIGPIPNGNYTPALLCQTLESLLKDVDSGFSCSLNAVNGRISIRNVGKKFVLSMLSETMNVGNRPTHWGLGYYLGFREGRATSAVVDGVNTVVAPSLPYTAPTPYYLMKLRCPDDVVNVYHQTTDCAHIEAFAKVILKDSYYTFQFDDNSNLMRKEFTFLSPVTVPFFEITLLDPWGTPVNMQDADWSVTLEVTEVVNSKTYDNLMTTYQRR